MCTGKPLLAEFQNTFGTIVFFPSCVYTSCKQSRSCFHGNIYLCEEFINPFLQEFHVEIPRRMQMGGVGGMLQCYFWQNLLFMKCNAFFLVYSGDSMSALVLTSIVSVLSRHQRLYCNRLWHLDIRKTEVMTLWMQIRASHELPFASWIAE